MSTLSSVTMGATASKKCREPGQSAAIFSAMASLDRGPVATTTSSSGISVASASTISIFGCAYSRSVMVLAKPSRSTASAPPAATRF